jgi:hypothetical protein
MSSLVRVRPAGGLVAAARAAASAGRAAPTRRLSTSSQLARFPKKQGLYDPALEKDSCGVGLVAHLKGVPSRAIVEDAGLALGNMEHRGGCGCDPQSGDGAGMSHGTITHAIDHAYLESGRIPHSHAEIHVELVAVAREIEKHYFALYHHPSLNQASRPRCRTSSSSAWPRTRRRSRCPRYGE